MIVLIDNKPLSEYGIICNDYTGAFAFPSERQDERIWSDKSGVDRNLSNNRYEEKEFTLSCICESTNEVTAYNLVKVLIEYIFTKKVFVLSFRDSERNIRECFLCERSSTIVPDINIREQNSLYVFKLGLKDVNPNAIKYSTTITALSASISYTKGKTALIYWGNGDNGIVSNSGTYSKDYASNELIDIIIDVDKDVANVTALQANFTADKVIGITPEEIQFTDTSTGNIFTYSWNFGDGSGSNEKNPIHIYTTAGIFDVTLQVFNEVGGDSTELKIGFIEIRRARILINSINTFLINSTNLLLKN
jgi:hypothetical protein